MKFIKRTLAVLTLLLSTTLFSQSNITGELQKWHTVNLTFDGPNTSENNNTNPFLDYRLNVTLKSPNGKIFLVPGFYAADGNAAETSSNSGNKWRVRFTPNETGRWTYTTSFRTGSNVAVSNNPNAGASTSFDGNSGSFNIAQSGKTLPDNRAKGRLNYVGERYLKFEETGDYFLKAGSDSPENLLAYNDFDNTVGSKSWSPHAQDWNNGDPTWKGANGKELIGAINYLSEKGMNAFSFLTMNVIGDGKDVWPWSATSNNNLDGSTGTDANNRLRYDVSKLAQWEILFSHADAKGMYLHFKTQETENDQLLDGGELGVQRKLYYRELIARFGHHLALNWNLGEENDIYQELNDPQNTKVKAYATFIKNLDPYQHNIVIHTYPNAQNNVYEPLLGSSDLTGASVQSDINNVHNDVKRWITASKNSGKQWVVANDEQGDAQRGVTADANYAGDKGNQSDNRKDVRNKTLWGTLMAGGAGVEYYFGYQTGETDLTAQDFRSRAVKWNDAKVALDFFKNNLSFWEMESNDALTANKTDYCLAKVNDTYAIYLPNGGTTNLNLSNATGSFIVKWFSPVNGGNLVNGSVTKISGGGNRSIGNPPNNTTADWVALIKKGEGTEPTSKEGCDADAVERNGLVVIEAENLNTSSGWLNETSAAGFTGKGYIDWQGSNSFSKPGNGTVSAKIKINTPGTYLFQWRNKVGEGTNPTESNDTWLRFPDADDFFGKKGNNKIYAKGSGKSPVPNGSGADGWLKVYSSGTTNWSWSTSTSDNDPHEIYVKFDKAGTFTMELSGRSKNHLIDRIVLSNGVDATDLKLKETRCSTEETTTVSVSSIAVTPQTASVIAGNTLNLTVKVLPANATNKNVIWSSSNKSIATVDKNGVVRAIKAGDVIITATSADSSRKSNATITVTEKPVRVKPVTNIYVTPQNVSIAGGETTQLSYQITPSDASNLNVKWTSKNKAIATVDQNGVVSGIKKGVVKIAVLTEDGNFLSDSKITVTTSKRQDIAVTGVVISNSSATLKVGETSTISYDVVPSDATNKNTTWRSSDASIATVSQDGVVTAIKQGDVVVSVTSEDGGYSASAAITVKTGVAVRGIYVVQQKITLEAGLTVELSYRISPRDATNKNVIWSSDNESVATVDANGKVTALKAGSVEIEARTIDGGFRSDSSIKVIASSAFEAVILATGIAVNPESASVKEGKTVSLGFQFTPSNTTDKNVSWSSSDSAVAKVNQNGVVTGVEAGVAFITVTTADGDFASTSTVTVTPKNTASPTIPMKGIYVFSQKVTLQVKKTTAITYTYWPKNATNKTIIWSSTNTSVATVDQNGVVTARRVGVAKIQAKTEDGGFVSDATLKVINGSAVSKQSLVANAQEIDTDEQRNSAENSNKIKSITVFPNPTSDEVRIKGIYAEGAWVGVHSMSGIMLRRKEIDANQETVLSLREYPSGTYLIKVYGLQNSTTKTVVKR